MGTALAGPGWWALATLLGGVLVAGRYWAVHCSAHRPGRLAKEHSEDTAGMQ